MDQILENDASEELKTTDMISSLAKAMRWTKMKMKFIKTNLAMHTQRRIHLITKRNLQKEKFGPL